MSVSLRDCLAVYSKCPALIFQCHSNIIFQLGIIPACISSSCICTNRLILIHKAGNFYFYILQNLVVICCSLNLYNTGNFWVTVINTVSGIIFVSVSFLPVRFKFYMTILCTVLVQTVFCTVFPIERRYRNCRSNIIDQFLFYVCIKNSPACICSRSTFFR